MKYIGLSLDPKTHDLHFVTDETTYGDGALHSDGSPFSQNAGDLAMVTDAHAVGQSAKQHLKFFLGEWFLDRSAGVPYFEYVFVRPFREEIAEAVIKDAILETMGVTAIEEFSVSYLYDRREIGVRKVRVMTEFDEVVAI